MDFFEHQETARRKTGLLIVYFLLAVVAIIGAIYLVLAFFFLASAENEAGMAVAEPTLWDPGLFGLVALGTTALVGGGSLYKIASLAGGGHTVAELLGGRLIHPDTRDPDERRVLNVVEEMAIASGTPVPPVYLMDQEPAINAFAAGYTPNDAVIGVTRGCIQTLSRDELQGVMAHEFSHILNGDMRLNIRLMGVLFGILLIGITGWIIFRSTMYSNMRARSDNKGGNPLPLIGLALYIIGYVGVFFGRLIQSAVSRQREYLADASAVQFTRNPEGIAGALKKIGAISAGSRLKNPEAGEAAHMFFGEGIGGAWLSLMATHPPLADRIRRIDPNFDGDFSKVSLAPPSHARIDREKPKGPSRKAETGRMKFDPVEAITKIGTIDPQRLAYAAALLESFPEPITRLTHDPYSARVLVYGLLIDRDSEHLDSQLQALAGSAGSKIADQTRSILPEVQGVELTARLPLVELALPALRQLSPDQYRAFQRDVRALIEADRRISLYEFALLRLLMRHLGPQFGNKTAPSVRYRSAAAISEPTGTLLTAIARVGQPHDSAEARRSFESGVQALGWDSVQVKPASESGLEAVSKALDVLLEASAPLKRDVLRACASAVGSDGQITVEEGELLRAIADSLDSPMPPILAEAS
ncbi:M48 family metallopeptidase [Tautonia marina]|uniref:M48 family metallopeptidase n=1 Tax=Tautonia marina TaxID=2653855 RepID=UPI001375D2E0|nr:M48 family metallopeptidase [Tautonia marina]